MCFFFNDTATTEIYTLSLHDALPIYPRRAGQVAHQVPRAPHQVGAGGVDEGLPRHWADQRVVARRVERRSEEHTSELQSRQYLVCRLLLEKKNNLQLPTPFCPASTLS